MGGHKKNQAGGIEDEVNNIWSYLQRFADEHALDKVEIIKSEVEPL